MMNDECERWPLNDADETMREQPRMMSAASEDSSPAHRSSFIAHRSSSAPPPWYRSAFQAKYLELYAHRNEADAARAVEFIRSVVPLGSDTRVLDLCCGAGRHLRMLAPLCGTCVGLDLSRVLLVKAVETLRRGGVGDGPHGGAGGPGGLVEGDMRSLPLRSRTFDLVTNLFTSFGYFDDDAENETVIREIARILKPGGRAIIDHINRRRLLDWLEPKSERQLPNGARIRESRSFDAAARRIVKRVEWNDPTGGVSEWTESVRVYELEEMGAMLDAAGLKVEGVDGDFDGSPFGADSPRMIARARKPD